VLALAFLSPRFSVLTSSPAFFLFHGVLFVDVASAGVGARWHSRPLACTFVLCGPRIFGTWPSSTFVRVCQLSRAARVPIVRRSPGTFCGRSACPRGPGVRPQLSPWGLLLFSAGAAYTPPPRVRLSRILRTGVWPVGYTTHTRLCPVPRGVAFSAFAPRTFGK